MDTQAAYEAMRSYFNRPGAVLAKGTRDFAPCRYRTIEGAKCAVGCLIPDEMYQEEFEGKRLYALLREQPELRGYLWNVDRKFLAHAQRLHDAHAQDAELLVELLDLLAMAHGLSLPDRAWWQ